MTPAEIKAARDSHEQFVLANVRKILAEKSDSAIHKTYARYFSSRGFSAEEKRMALLGKLAGWACHIKADREALGLSIPQIAYLMETDERSWRRFERGDRPPSARVIPYMMALNSGYRPDDWPLDNGD